MNACINCLHANTLYYTTSEEQTNFKFCPHYIYCDYFNEPKEIQDECKNFEEDILPF